ncbi:MAG: dTDP-4-dehydrorhamnose 3,5-epimerase [Sphingomicrobium sp.]
MSPIVITPRRLGDERGWFSETYNARRLAEHGIVNDFCQDNQSLTSARGTLRGLHYQRTPSAQAKLVRCLAGRIFDVAVDIRRASPTFGRWIGIELSADNGRQLFVPVGYAHAFLTLEPDCMVAYKVDAFFSAECDSGIVWNDPDIGIDWPLDGPPQLSPKDATLPLLATLDAEFDYDGIPLGELRQIET